MKLWKLWHWLFGWDYVAVDSLVGYKVFRLRHDEEHGLHIIRKNIAGTPFVDRINKQNRQYTEGNGAAMTPLTW